MNRGLLLACCVILFLLSAAITSRLANDDGPFEPRQVPQPIIADAPAIVVPPPPPETDSRREQLERIISSIEAPDLQRAMPIVGFVRKEDGTPISGATIVAQAKLDRPGTFRGIAPDRLIRWIEGEVQEDRVNSAPKQVTSDENGRFELTHLSLTRYQISAEHPRWNFNRAIRNTKPGSLIVFLAQESKPQVDLQVRLADGSIPAKAEVVFAPGRYTTQAVKRNFRTKEFGAYSRGISQLNNIVAELSRKFTSWTPENSVKEVEPGFHTAIARSSDGRVSDVIEVFIEKSAGKQHVLLEIPQTGAMSVDLVQTGRETDLFRCFLLQIDKQRPPPVSALFGAGVLEAHMGLSTWPRTVHRVPPGAYLVGVGAGSVIWGHRIVEVSDQPVEVIFDLFDATEGNFLHARVVDHQGTPLKTKFKLRSIRSRTDSTRSVKSLPLEEEGTFRIALPDLNSANQLFLIAETDEGSIELPVGEDRGQIFEYRFGSNANVKIEFSGFGGAWEKSLQIALVPPGDKIGSYGDRWQRMVPPWGGSSEHPSGPAFLSKDLGNVQAGDYDLLVATDIHRLSPPIEVLRLPVTIGGYDLEIPIDLPPLYQIEVLQSAQWPFTIATPEGSPIDVFPDEGETTVTLPTGSYHFSVGTVQKTIDVPHQRQVDLRGGN